MFSSATILLALAASATAHMTILNPVPFGKDTLTSSPLAPGDFPCKQRSGVYDITEMNQWNAGETQTISFQGSAVHGGGSCQFSLTTDPEPTEQSQWKVIHSVIGGCPSNVSGNLPEAPEGRGAATFPVTMPENIPDGRYTFAWTWLNKVGNREFYMNCAPVQVGDGSSKASTASVSAAFSSLPDMFVANLPDTSCSTAENEDFNYPNPGQSVVEGNGSALGDTLTGAGCDQMTKMGAGNGQMGSPTQPEASQPAASQAPAATSGYAAPPASSEAPAATSGYAALPSNGGGVFAPGASSAPAAEPTAPAAAPTPTYGAEQPSSVPEQPAYSAAPQVPDNSTPSAPASGSDCTPCDNDGAVVCMGENQFGLCNRGCAVPQALANGMSCSAGAVVATASLKRSPKFPRAHLHRRHGSSLFV
jgi:hypothetical protein